MADMPAEDLRLPPLSRVRRATYVTTGLACVAAGVVGIVVPGLPTTVFLIAAAWLFARSSPSLYRRLLGQRHLRVYLMAAEDRAMPPRCKVAAVLAIWVGTGIACWSLRTVPWALGAVVVAALVGSWVVLFWVRTRATASETRESSAA